MQRIRKREKKRMIEFFCSNCDDEDSQLETTMLVNGDLIIKCLECGCTEKLKFVKRRKGE